MFNKIKVDCLNFILRHNQSTQVELASLANQTFNINVLGICLSAKINHDGSLDYYDESNTHDVEILIPLKATSHLLHQDELTTFKQLTINGDHKLGRELLEIFARLNIDNLYPESPLFGVILLQVERLIKTIKAQLILLSRNSSQSISEYLLYETNDLVTRFEIDSFCQDVDTLLEQTELLEQKINRLMNNK